MGQMAIRLLSILYTRLTLKEKEQIFGKIKNALQEAARFQ
jgi:hypothetical protein